MSATLIQTPLSSTELQQLERAGSFSFNGSKELSSNLNVGNFTSTKANLVENLEQFLNLFDGSEHNEEALRAAYEKVFDKKLTSIDRVSGLGALSENRTKYDFESLYDAFAVCSQKQAHIDHYSIEPRPKGGLIYSLHIPFCNGHDVTVEVSAKTRNGKIVHHERHNVLFTAVENLTTFFSLFDGSQYDEQKLQQAFEKTFDKSLSSLTFPVGTKPEDTSDLSNRVELDYDANFVQVATAYRKTGSKLILKSINPLPEGAIEYEIQGLYMGRVGTVRCTAMTRNGLITRYERTGTVFSKVVSGQVVAQDADADLAKNVLELPTQAGGRLLCGKSTEILPCSNEGEVLKLFMETERKLRRRFSLTSPTALPMSAGVTKITSKELGTAYSNDASVYNYRRPMGHAQCSVLREENEPVVLCLQDRHACDNAFLIMSRNPLFPEDEPLGREKGIGFFPWYRVATISVGSNAYRAISVWTGHEYKPFMKIQESPNPTEQPIEASFISIGENTPQKTFARLQQTQLEERSGYEVVICPGADPALFICVAALDFCRRA